MQFFMNGIKVLTPQVQGRKIWKRQRNPRKE